MSDRNDPEQLGQAILAYKVKHDCTITEAADAVYSDMRDHGWWFPPEGDRSAALSASLTRVAGEATRGQH